LVKSPCAPKITSVAGGAGLAPAADTFAVVELGFAVTERKAGFWSKFAPFKGSPFFSEEKKQKTLMTSPLAAIRGA
jgi:hypothetical protein